MMNPTIPALLLLISGAASAASPVKQTLARETKLLGQAKMEIEGELYDIDDPTVLLFRLTRFRQPTSDQQELVKTIYRTPEAEFVAEERLFFRKDGTLARYELDYPWIHEAYAIDASEWTIDYQLLDTKTGKIKKTQEGIKHNLVIGGQIVDFVKQNFATIQKKKGVPFKFAIPDLQDTFSFELKPWENKQVPEGMEGIRMSPTSVVLDMVVGSLKIYVDPKTGRANRVLGRSFLHKRTPKGLKHLYGDMRLRYSDESAVAPKSVPLVLKKNSKGSG